MVKNTYIIAVLVCGLMFSYCVSQEVINAAAVKSELLVIDELHNNTEPTSGVDIIKDKETQEEVQVLSDDGDYWYEDDEQKVESTPNNNFKQRFGNFSGRVVSTTINITLDVEDVMTVESENYPDPYPTNESTVYEWFIGTGETSYGIEMIVKHLDFAENDYFIVKPGGVEQPPDSQIVFAHYLDKERKYSLRHLDEMYFAFFVNMRPNNVHKGFQIEFRRVGARETTEPPTSTLEPPITVPPQNRSTIFLGGKTQDEFFNISEEFKLQLAHVAEIYCLDKNITIDENLTISDNVNYHVITRCTLEWPSSDRCVEIIYSIGVSYNNETDEYELSQKHLDDMWNNYQHLLDIAGLGFYVYQPPDNHQALITWIIVSVVIIGLFCILILVTSRYNCFSEYPRREILRPSVISQKLSNSSLFPTPHQTVPPFYGMDYYSPEDDQFWAKEEELPPKYNGGMTGQRNEGFVHDDEILDLYSEEIVMSRPENRQQTEFRVSNRGESVL